MLSEVSQRKTMLYDFPSVWNLKTKQTKQNRNRLKDTENKLVVVRGERVGEGDYKVQTSSYKINVMGM